MINDIYDIAIVGGGINGTGIAADASNRGLRVMLIEQNDLSSATSSSSSKLIHGGLRYLEHHEFRLVREALNEREVLLRKAKHLVKPLNFILPHQSKLRSRFIIRIGLFLYDHLARRSTLPKTKAIYLKNHAAGKYLKKKFKFAFQYSDCSVDDSRLVIANAMQAAAKGAKILTYTECVKAEREDNIWNLTLKDRFSGNVFSLKSRVLINATGPWVDDFFQNKVKVSRSQHSLELVKGSHIVIPKLYDENFAFIMQNDDQRVVFIIPYLEHFSLIGTTDIIYKNSPSEAGISSEEIDYLIRAVNQYLQTPVTKKDILHTFSGVRPLLKSQAENPAANTRDYAIDINADGSSPPLVSIFGGKLTTYRKLSEKAIDMLCPFFKDLSRGKTSEIPLPGGDFNNEESFLHELEMDYRWLDKSLLHRYIRQYGTNTKLLLEKCNRQEDLGTHFGSTLYQREVDYLVTNEWAKTVDDILWRRTKLGYFFPSNKRQELHNYLNSGLS